MLISVLSAIYWWHDFVSPWWPVCWRLWRGRKRSTKYSGVKWYQDPHRFRHVPPVKVKTPGLVDTIKTYRGSLPITIKSSYSLPFDVPPVRGWEKAYARMNKVDREKWNHSPELYAVWNAKPFLLNSAVQLLDKHGKVYDYAFWNDGGSFRSEHLYTTWPDSGRVEQVWDQVSKLTGTQKKNLLFFPIFETMDAKVKNWQENMGPIANPGGQFSEGKPFCDFS